MSEIRARLKQKRINNVYKMRALETSRYNLRL